MDGRPGDGFRLSFQIAFYHRAPLLALWPDKLESLFQGTLIMSLIAKFCAPSSCSPVTIAGLPCKCSGNAPGDLARISGRGASWASIVLPARKVSLNSGDVHDKNKGEK